MILSNTLGLPEAIVEAVRNDDYDPGESDITVTQLIAPPRLVALRRLHDSELREDASDRIFSLMGQIVHGILERSDIPSVIREERLYTTVGGVKVGGKMDRMILFPSGLIQDYKLCSIYASRDGAKSEWIQQLNCLAFLAAKNGYHISSLEVVAIFRDWSLAEAMRRPEGDWYPKRQVQIVHVPLWSHDTTGEFIEDRIRIHEDAKRQLPHCSPSEQWKKDSKWKIIKVGGKRASKVFDDEYLARSAYEELGDLREKYELQEHPGEYTRCSLYCPVMTQCRAQNDGQPLPDIVTSDLTNVESPSIQEVA